MVSEASMETLPIDIDHSKFLSWLIDRRRIPRDWHTHLKSARSLLRHAITTTPVSAQHSLNLTPPDPLTPPVPYFHALDILTALTAPNTPPDWLAGPEKDLLGRYKAPTSRSWQAAVSAFEKKYVFLADCAQLLVRNADVEAKALKDRILTLQKEVTELARKDSPAVRAAAEARERFEIACEEFGLDKEGDLDFYGVLKKSVDGKVPVALREAVECVRGEEFREVVHYYANFVAYIKGLEGGEGLVCVAVNRVMEGDVEVLVRAPSGECKGAEESPVDWGIELTQEVGGDESASGGIDWGIEIDATGTTGLQVQEDGNEEGEANGTAESGVIDWNEMADVQIEEGEAGEIAVDDMSVDAFTLADPKSRETYLNDLIELDAFLAQRTVELSRAGNTEIGLVMQQAAGTPDFVKTVDVDRVSIFQEAVRKAISAINSADTRRILALQSDSRRLERAAKAILEKKHVAERMHAAIDVFRKRRSKALAELALETPKLEKLGNVTRDIKKRTEKALSELYRGRTVNILGDINSVFPPVH